MWADRGPQDPQGHITGTPHRFLFTPCSLLPAPRSLLFTTPPPPTPGQRASSGYLPPGPPAPRLALTSPRRQSYQVWTESSPHSSGSS